MTFELQRRHDGYEPPNRRKPKGSRVPTRESSCVRKSSYTQSGAEVQIRFGKTERGVQLYSYKCLYCDMWHLTSKAPEN